MLYDLVLDVQMIFYVARFILLWTLIHKSILWACRNDIMPFNATFGAMYIIFLYSDMEGLRIVTGVILFIINCLHLLSK